MKPVQKYRNIYCVVNQFSDEKTKYFFFTIKENNNYIIYVYVIGILYVIGYIK